MFLLRVYMAVTRCIGLLNLRYDSDRHRFNKHHKPTIVYCIVLNIIYIVLLPLATYHLLDIISGSETANLQLYVNNTIGMSEVFTFYLTIYGTWLRRGRLQCIANAYVRYIREYTKYIYAATRRYRANLLAARLLMAAKMLTAICKVIAVYAYFYDDMISDFVSDEKFELTTNYVISVTFIINIATFLTLVDCNIFVGLLLADLLLATLQQQLRNTCSEMHLMLKYKRSTSRDSEQFRAVWQQQLSQYIAKLAKRQLQLKLLLSNLLGIYQVQLLMNLLCSFLVLIMQLYTIVLLIVAPGDIRLGSILFYLSIMLASLGNLMLTFYVCERIRLRFSSMREIVYQTWLYAGAARSTKTGKVNQLEVCLEQFSLELQQQPCNLNICGFFDLSMNTGMQMTEAIVLNMLLLLQLVHKGL